MRRRLLLRLSLSGLAAAPVLFAMSPVRAQSLDEAKANGWLGERIDGYVGVVRADTPAELRALAEDINARRRQKYAEIAEKRDVPVEAVAQIAGKKLIEQAPAGQFVLGADGQWRQK